MLNTNPSTMDSIDAMIILSQGVIATLFTFFPLFLIVFRELEKFKNQDIKEHTSGQSSFSFLFIIMIGLALAKILYIAFVLFVKLLAPQWGDISGSGGVTATFWSIVAPSSSDGFSPTMDKTWVYSMLNTIDIARTIIETLAFFSILVIMFLSMKLSLTILSAYQEDTSRNGLVGTVGKIALGMVVGMFVIQYYDMATTSILNHPSGGPWGLAVDWLEKGIEGYM